MKGIIFKEFLVMVENTYGYKMVDDIITESGIKSRGAYTSVGTYDFSELVQLLVELYKKTGVDIPDLLKAYGEFLFSVFEKKYQHLFSEINNSFQFLANVENNIHIEVLKLYPEAELPRLTVEEMSYNRMVITYQSERKMADFAEGLMLGCFKHFDETVKIEKQAINPDGSEVQFTIERIQ
ncbi:MAG: heme NO-binding domain-containing protein [Bacteroidales bacterium]|nr:heme NO-binding domain-containing protein [Bacteroidales bacterium]